MSHQHLKSKLLQAQALINEALSQVDPPLEIYTQEQVLQAICQRYKVTPEAIFGGSKKGTLDDARPAYCYMLFNHVTKNYSLISKMMNRKSHASAHETLKRANGLYDTNKSFRYDIQKIREMINQI